MTDPSAGRIRVALADDHALFRDAMRSLLALDPAFAIVADIARAADLVSTIERIPSDILLLDLNMERSAVIDIRVLSAHTAIVVVTANEEPAVAVAAVREGARAIVFKRYAPETLLTAIHTVANGGQWLPEIVLDALQGRERTATGEDLTTREREIVVLVARGMHNAEIAQWLSIREGTVKTHLTSAFQKMGVRRRMDLALHAFRHGWLPEDDRNR